MRKICRRFLPLLTAIILFLPSSVQASHVFGAEIEWQSLGKDSFEIIVHAYRDCNGMSINDGNLTYQTPGDTCAGSPVNIKSNICCGADITPVCDKSCDRCQSNSCSFAYGIEEYKITAIVYLPSPCCSYTIAWEEDSRSSTITTGAANSTCYVEDYLNRCIKPGISSPHFSGPPITIFCVNQCTVLNAGIVDNDVDSAGRPDSISYSLGMPQSAQGTDIPYSTPYTYDAPLIYAGTSKKQPYVPPYCYGFHLDSTNGDIEFKAIKTDVSVYVLVVDIYRRDSKGIEQKLGEIKRDLEIIVIDCPSNGPPIIPGINGTSAYSIKICSGQQTCFNVKAFDLDQTDTDTIAWNSPETMKGATFTVVNDGKKWPTAIFCWTPQKTDISSIPYSFTVNAIDNACPISGRASRAFSVYVTGVPPLATYSVSQKCGLANFQANPSPSSSSISGYLWTGDSTSGGSSLHITTKSGTYQYTAPGLYHYKLTVMGSNGCTTDYKDSIIIPKIPQIKLPRDTTVCPSAKLFIGAIVSNYVKPYTINWNTGDTGANVFCSITKDTILVAGIKDASGCIIYDSMKITMSPLPIAHWFMNYLGNVAFFHARDSSLTDTSYNWIFGDGNSGKGHSIKHLYPKNQVYTPSLFVTNSIGCSNKFDSSINIVLSGVKLFDNNDFSLSIYPNPFSSFASIQYSLKKFSRISIILYDITGRQIAIVKNETEGPGIYRSEINAEKYHLNPGVYFLKVMTEDGYINRQIVRF